jgi:DNA helicase-2/ATP-dependent DNA helicase PcrA
MSLQKEKLVQKFNEEYNKLNEQQKQAVDKIYGPVMVIAGPGTGKTQILSVRIGKILLETDYLPSNILCLTYTDAGVLAMRKRLVNMIGPDAYSVQIHSFHSFCNMVIQQNIHLFHKKELQPINDLEQAQCLIELIDGFDNSNPLKRYKTDAYFEATFLKELFGTMKREGWTEGFLEQKIGHYVDEIIPETFANKVKLKKGIIELTVKGREEIEKMEKLKAAVQAFPRYQQLLKEKQRYDFDDMINWVIQVFETNADVLAGYQEQYQFFLVDEYQDTSGAQNKLVELLVSFWEEESPNLFVVGDDDQSIYRFQGANMENMRMLANKYTDLLRVVLTQNYRSTQPILDYAHSLIQNNTQRLTNEYKDLQKILTASNPLYKEVKTTPLIRSVSNEFEENIIIAEEIRQLIEDGVLPGKIAVIYKEHRTGDELQKFLQLQDIPYYTKKSINLLKEPFIKKILSYLDYVLAEKEIPFSGEPVLFQLLHHNFHTIPALKIAALSNEVYLNGRNNKKDQPRTIREYLSMLATKNKQKLFAGDDVTDELIRLHQLLEKLITDSENLPLLKWFEALFSDANIISHIMQQPEKARLMQLLNGFFDYVQDECRRNPDLDLKDLSKQMDLLEENGISIPLLQTSGNERGVNLLTCHGSKGLEYEYVFFIGCYSGLWEGKRKNGQGYKLPPNVFTKETPEEKEEELRRLFFVAATRAERHLFISFPSFNNEGKALEASRFIAEMANEIQAETVTIPQETKLKYSSLRYGTIQQPELEKAEKDFIEQLLAGFKMNVTALNNYLECPVKFYYNSLIRIPAAYSESAQFGTSMHDALSFYYNKMMESDRVYPPKEVLLNRFQWHINYNRQVFTEESLKRFTDYGLKCLAAYHETYFARTGDEFIRTEVPMEALLDTVPIKGFADKIQYWGNEVTITDFKTGSLEKANRRFEFAEPYHPKKPEGGNYWRQAIFYKLLFDRQRGATKELRSIEFHFIEPNDKEEFDIKKIISTPEYEEFVQQQITETWDKIQAHDFYKGCGKPDCYWCNFVKDHKFYVALHEMEEEIPEPLQIV